MTIDKLIKELNKYPKDTQVNDLLLFADENNFIDWMKMRGLDPDDVESKMDKLEEEINAS